MMIQKTMLMACVIMLTAAAVPAQDKPAADIGEYLSLYYQNPEPAKAAGMLNGMIWSDDFKQARLAKNNGFGVAAYSFARIAQIEKSVIPRYHELFENAAHHGRIFLLQVLRLCGDESTREFLKQTLKDEQEYGRQREQIESVLAAGIPMAFDPVAREVKKSEDLDYLWAEFMISGDTRAVEAIIGVMTRPERLRGKLSSYLKGKASGAARRRMEKTLADEFSIRISANDRTIRSWDDIDVLFAVTLKNLAGESEKVRDVIESLELSEEDFFYCALKGAAGWSLEQNARRDEAVLKACEARAGSLEGPGRIRLLTIAARTRLSMGDSEEARKHFDDIAALDPLNARAHYGLGLTLLKTNNPQLASVEVILLKDLNADYAQQLEEEAGYDRLHRMAGAFDSPPTRGKDIAALEQKAIRSARRTRSYQSRFYIKDYAEERFELADYAYMEWDMEYEQPDRYAVRQISRAEGTADNWITVGKTNYYRLNDWFEETGESEEGRARFRTNRFLSLEKYSDLMEKNDPESVHFLGEGAEEYAVFRYRPEDLSVFFLPRREKSIESSVDLWVKRLDGQFLKAVLTLKGQTREGRHVETEYEQLFLGHGERFGIRRPKDAIKIKKRSKDDLPGSAMTGRRV